jgi:hypothetical protein
VDHWDGSKVLLFFFRNKNKVCLNFNHSFQPQSDGPSRGCHGLPGQINKASKAKISVKQSMHTLEWNLLSGRVCITFLEGKEESGIPSLRTL